MSDRNQAIGFLIHDNVTMVDIAGPADVFHHANAFGARYETVLVSADGTAKRASNGHYLTAEAAAGQTGALDTVIVPGPLQTLDSRQNISNPNQSGTGTAQSATQCVDTVHTPNSPHQRPPPNSRTPQ